MAKLTKEENKIILTEDKNLGTPAFVFLILFISIFCFIGVIGTAIILLNIISKSRLSEFLIFFFAFWDSLSFIALYSIIRLPRNNSYKNIFIFDNKEEILFIHFSRVDNAPYRIPFCDVSHIGLYLEYVYTDSDSDSGKTEVFVVYLVKNDGAKILLESNYSIDKSLSLIAELKELTEFSIVDYISGENNFTTERKYKEIKIIPDISNCSNFLKVEESFAECKFFLYKPKRKFSDNLIFILVGLIFFGIPLYMMRSVLRDFSSIGAFAFIPLTFLIVFFLLAVFIFTLIILMQNRDYIITVRDRELETGIFFKIPYFSKYLDKNILFKKDDIKYVRVNRLTTNGFNLTLCLENSVEIPKFTKFLSNLSSDNKNAIVSRKTDENILQLWEINRWGDKDNLPSIFDLEYTEKKIQEYLSLEEKRVL